MIRTDGIEKDNQQHDTDKMYEAYQTNISSLWRPATNKYHLDKANAWQADDIKGYRTPRSEELRGTSDVAETEIYLWHTFRRVSRASDVWHFRGRPLVS